MKEETIQTLHPIPGKVNKTIAKSKYILVREHILAILKESELSHLDLMENLYTRLKDNFQGGIQWYGEVVKLDLEARKIIERSQSKPVKYSIIATNLKI